MAASKGWEESALKRLTIYILVVALALLIPEEANNVGSLQPVELIFLYMEDETVVLQTDTGDLGRGKSVAEAFMDLKATTAGTIFLDTADYLVVTDEAGTLLGEIAAYVKPSVQLCLAEKGLDLVLAAEYLSVHASAMTLESAQNGGEFPKIEQFCIAGKNILKIRNSYLTNS